MKFIVFFALVSVVVARPKPGGLYGGWDHGLSSVNLVHQPAVVAQPTYTVAQPVVHAAPVAYAKPATSYASFQQIVHPVSVAQPVVHAAPVVHSAPVYSQPIVHAVAQPVVHAAPVVQTIAQPVVQKYLSLGSYGHGW